MASFPGSTILSGLFSMKRLLTLIVGACAFAPPQGRHGGGADVEPTNSPGTLTGTTMTGLLPSSAPARLRSSRQQRLVVHQRRRQRFRHFLGLGSLGSGDYWQFQTSTVGFTGIQLSPAQRAVFNGPTNFNLAFSLDGVNFTTAVTQYGVRSDANLGAWTSGSPNAGTISSFNLSSFTQLNNASAVYFRVRANVPGPGKAGLMIVVLGTVVPEPTTLALLGAATLLGGYHTRTPSARLTSPEYSRSPP